MEFYEYKSLYDAGPKALMGMLPVEEFYPQFILPMIEMFQKGSTGSHESAQCHGELSWYRSSKPYYKIWPGVIPFFVETKIEFSHDLLRCPFSAFEIRLPKNQGNALLRNKHGELRSLLVYEDKDQAVIREIRRNRPDVGPMSRIWWIYMDFGETFDGLELYGKIPSIYEWLCLYFEEGMGIDQMLEIAAGHRSAHSEITPESSDAIMRVVAATCFLATGADKIVQRDVLNKHLERYHQSSDPVERQRLEEKARRKNKYGWTIGREYTFPYPIRDQQETQYKRGPLEFQHQRCAHFRVVRRGPGRSESEVKFIPQTTVRADLPLPTIRHRGYKSRRGKVFS